MCVGLKIASLDIRNLKGKQGLNTEFISLPSKSLTAAVSWS